MGTFSTVAPTTFVGAQKYTAKKRLSNIQAKGMSEWLGV